MTRSFACASENIAICPLCHAVKPTRGMEAASAILRAVA